MKNININRVFILAVLLPLIILTSFQCTNESKLLKDIPVTDYIDNCPDVLYDFGETINIGDPEDRFLIGLPYSWDIRENYSDSLYGIFATNFQSIPEELEDRMGISLTGYKSDKTLEEYVHDELIELIKEENITVMETGKTMIAGQKYPWVLFEIQPDVYNMVYYIKQPDMGNFYLIQSVSYDAVNYRTKMCYLKRLVTSFEMVVN